MLDTALQRDRNPAHFKPIGVLGIERRAIHARLEIARTERMNPLSMSRSLTGHGPFQHGTTVTPGKYFDY